MVAIVAVTSYYQQKQIQGRNPNAEMPPQQKMIMRLMPAMFVVFAFVAPSALVVYFIVSNLYRIGMQAYITRTLYHGEDSLGAQAQQASLEARKLKEEAGGSDAPAPARQAGQGDRGRQPRRRATATAATNGDAKARRPSPPPPHRPPAPRNAQNRSKKKKRRR